MDLKKTALREEISPYPSFLFLKVDHCEKEEKLALSSNELGIPLGILNIFGMLGKRWQSLFWQNIFSLNFYQHGKIQIDPSFSSGIIVDQRTFQFYWQRTLWANLTIRISEDVIYVEI